MCWWPEDGTFPAMQSGLNRAWVTQFLGPTAIGWGSCCTGTPAEGMHMGEGFAFPYSRQVAGAGVEAQAS